jgi:hypothetical protein
MSQLVKVVQGDITFQADFSEPAFALFSNQAALHKMLFEQLGSRFGLAASGMQPKLILGSLADVQLTCSLARFSTSVGLSTERVEIGCSNSLQLRQQDFAEIALSTLNTVAAYISVPYKAYRLSVNFHGTLADMSTPEYLARFTPNTPQALGPRIGSGVVFYYGADAERLSSFVTLDFSAYHAGALYVRMQGVWDAEKVTLVDLPSVAENYVQRMIAAIDLTLPEPSK